MKMAVIYALCEPGTRTVRYIGKTEYPNRRLREHLNSSVYTETHLGRWLRSLKLRGHAPAFVLLSRVPVIDWQSEEIKYIAAAKTLGMCLVNATDGGEGANNPSAETRFKMGANRGKKLSEERKQEISRTQIGSKRPPVTDSHRAALSKSLRGKGRGSKKPDARSKFIGVYHRRSEGKWGARIWVDGKTISLKTFKTELDAALAHDVAAKKYFGTLAVLNFP